MEEAKKEKRKYVTNIKEQAKIQKELLKNKEYKRQPVKKKKKKERMKEKETELYRQTKEI